MADDESVYLITMEGGETWRFLIEDFVGDPSGFLLRRLENCGSGGKMASRSLRNEL